ncbi:hypothetical protein [Novosphingobium sp.]|uniref:hypothetical protein n=1 Tax=Novosphingobium sp. TaxID=1874826 RepID=UPI0025F0D162|nr:hypothetical protein [Novosphingobium sp.]MCC6925607.1 hypothetical protein [Novosphingobium sp.]
MADVEAGGVSTLFLAASAVLGLTGSYDCEIANIAAISVDGEKASASKIGGMPKEALRFRLELKGDKASIDWKESPFQIDGKNMALLPTGPESGMILAVSGGPCMFTEAACATMINFAKSTDGSLRLLLVPSAVSTDDASKERAPFLVSMQAQCLARKAS